MITEQTEPVVQDTPSLQQYLTFALAGEEYAVDILKVKEIRSWRTPTPLPHSPDYMLGVINLRGAIIPVVDLRRQFSLASVPPSNITGVIVVNTEILGRARSIGLVVDQVLNVVYLELDPVAPSEDNSGHIGTRYISGLCRSGENLVIAIDLESIIEASLNRADKELQSADVS
jgi:purine-binding chemotaxis protein CheW